jgi:uncharacterized cupredoxin-like copper-binding protein
VGELTTATTHRRRALGVLAAGSVALAACGGDGAGDAMPMGAAPAADTGTDIEVTGTDSVRFEPDTLTVPAGEEVTLTFSADSGVEHDFVIEGAATVGTADAEREGDLHVVRADPGETATATFRVDEPGSYAVYCSVPGHRDTGMVATLTARGQERQ